MSSKGSKPAPPTAPPLLAQCLQAAAAPGDLQVLRFRAPRAWERGLVDGAISLRVAGQRADFAVLLRQRIATDSAIALRPLQREVETHGSRLLVCTRRATRAQTEQFRASGISLLDTTGTLSLQADGLRVHCLGKAPAAAAGIRRTTSTDARILHALMRTDADAPSNQRELAQAAGVSLGAVGTALRALEARRLLRRRGEHRWIVIDPAAAQARFVEDWATMLRRKLAPTLFRALEPDWIDSVPARLAALAPAALLGGELAAIRLGASLQTESLTLHVTPQQRSDVVQRLRLLPDATGPITVLDRFGHGDAFPDPELPSLLLAHPLLVHAELGTRGEERLTESMATVWRTWITKATR